MIATFVSHPECSATGGRLSAGRVHALSPAGKPLPVRYDLDAARRQVVLFNRATGLK